MAEFPKNRGRRAIISLASRGSEDSTSNEIEITRCSPNQNSANLHQLVSGLLWAREDFH